MTSPESQIPIEIQLFLDSMIDKNWLKWLQGLLIVSKDKGYGYIKAGKAVIGKESSKLALNMEESQRKAVYILMPLTAKELDYLAGLIKT